MLTWAAMWAATKGVSVPGLVVFVAMLCDCVIALGVAGRLAK